MGAVEHILLQAQMLDLNLIRGYRTKIHKKTDAKPKPTAKHLNYVGSCMLQYCVTRANSTLWQQAVSRRAGYAE